jgi:hypothetical protein
MNGDIFDGHYMVDVYLVLWHNEYDEETMENQQFNVFFIENQLCFGSFDGLITLSRYSQTFA